MELIKSKKAINDVSIIAILLFVLVGTASIIPFLNSTLDIDSDELNTDEITGEIKEGATSISVLSALGIIITVIKLASFDFGNTLGLPFWVDLVYTLLGIILIFLVARFIRGGGG